MEELKSTEFPRFFEELWGHGPFPWQVRLLDTVVAGGWPDYLDLPTASGKTAALDVAVFALAMQAGFPPEERTVGRRIFFVVNRRVIVDEAYERARKLAVKLLGPDSAPVVRKVAGALRHVSGDAEAPPLDVALLRGGIVRDNRWSRSVAQPTIVTSTIDQVGSRLLFRGYGVSEGARPLHAALIAHDSLLLLDEAHISQPFVQTLNAFKSYRGERWTEEPLNTPFAFVQMTATPGDTESEPFTLNAEDRAHPVLQCRHGRAKPTTLQIASGAKGKDPHPALARTLAEAAVGLLSGDRRNIAVVVNRIATARLVASLLAEQSGKKKVPDFEVHLAIGRMRPLDRDQLTLSIQQRVGPDGNTQPEAPPMFVVATQCLEVGADFDFDGMVSECASIDALRQRFGRLNRRGRDVDARGVVVVREDQVNDADDPVYGTALSKTWEWLVSKKDADNGSIDFGVQAMDRLSEDTDTSELLAPRLDAPVMFPAYVDIWAQTSPMPVPDPEVALFIHGPRGGEPDVQVCWRKDLTEGAQDDWVQVVSMLPPTTPECMSVPISAARRWLQGDPVNDENQADLLENTADEENGHAGTARSAVLWRGTRDSLLVSGALELRPGDTVVLPVWAEGWDVLGHVPPHAPRDIADLACRRSTGIASLRMRPDTLDAWAESDSRVEIMTWLANPEQNLRAADLRALLRALAEDAPSACADIAEAMRLLAGNRLGFEYERYPDGRGAVFRTKRAEKRPALLPALDDGDDRGSVLPTSVALPEHLNHVADTLAETLPLLPVAPWAQALQCAASLHDIGKADERFQAMLRRGNINAAWALPVPLAKSGGVPMSLAEWQQAANRCGFPKGFRHEMLSVQLAECASALLPEDELQRDLALHLIAAHHGHGRPFAPVVLDEDPPPVDLKPAGIVASLTAEARKSFPSHRLDSGIAERFWKLTRRYGWWGLAYLEAVLRLVDQRASQRESEMAQPSESPQTVETTA